MASDLFSRPSRAIGFKTSTLTDAAYTVGQLSYLISVRVANVLGATATVTIKWHNSVDSIDYTLINAQPIPPSEYRVYEFSAFALTKDDIIKITGSVNNTFHCVVTAIELSGRSI